MQPVNMHSLGRGRLPAKMPCTAFASPATGICPSSPNTLPVSKTCQRTMPTPLTAFSSRRP